MSIWDYYDVDDSVEVSGESSAGFSGGLSMANSRSISGPGDVYAAQGYSGSGGYVGMNYIYAQDASQTLALGSAHLTPDTLSVSQAVSIDDADVSAVVSTGDLGGRGAMQHSSVWDGSLDSRQTIEIDGEIVTSQDTQMVGFLPTAFGTAGYMNANSGPGTLKIEGEGAAVAVSSMDLAGPAEVDCRLATGTGNSAWAYGDVRSASSDLGAVGAGAGAGNIDFEVDLTGGLPGLYISGETEAAGVGVAAVGVTNEISGTLAAGTGFLGTAAYGEDVEASNDDGFVVAAAAAGGLGADVDLQNGIIGAGAEAAGVGVAAVGETNEISGTLGAGTGFFSTFAFGEDVAASNDDGFVVAAAAAGGLGAGADLLNGTIGAGAEAAGVGVFADGETNEISAGTLGAGTGFVGTGAFGEDVEASNDDGFVVAAAVAGGLDAEADFQNGLLNGTIDGGAEAAGVGVFADGETNEISAGVLGAGTGFVGTGAFGEDVAASNDDGFVVAAAVAGGLGAEADLQNGTIGGGAEAAGVDVAAVGETNEISAGALGAGTGLVGTGAFGEDVAASNDDGFVVAAAVAGGLGAEADFQNGLLNGTIDGGAEAAGVGVFADGETNEVSAGTLAAGTSRFLGTGAYGDDIEASNDNGFIVAAAAAGGLDVLLNLSDLNGTGGAECAIFGAGAAGTGNNLSVGSVEALTGNSAKVVARDVKASSCNGSAGVGIAAGNVQLDLVSGTLNVTGEGSAVGAGAIGLQAYAGADRLRAKSGDCTVAVGKNLTTSVEAGVAGTGAIGATYDSNRSGSGWEVASVEGDITGSGEICGNFRAETGQSANARANNLFVSGTDIHLESQANDSQSSSDADMSFAGLGEFTGRLSAYAGDSTEALIKGSASGNFVLDAEAISIDPVDYDSKHKVRSGDYDITVKAMTDDTGADAKAKAEAV